MQTSSPTVGFTNIIALKNAGVNLHMSNRCIHVFIGCNAQNHPHITKERGNDDTFNDDEFKYGPRLGSYGLANSKLASSLLNSNEHDVRNTHYATQQGKDADYPKGQFG